MIESVDQIEIIIPRPKVQEGSAFSAVAYFRDRATSAASVPTSAKFRVDNLTTGAELAGWTSLTPAASITIPITSTYTAIASTCNTRESVQLTVAGDYGLATQVRNAVIFTVENLYGSP